MADRANAAAIPTAAADAVGWITAEQMVEVDRVMIDDLGIALIQMMENAGRNLARLVLALDAPTRATVLAGPGGNGGGGLVAARHLANAGVDVVVTLARDAAALTAVPAHQYAILERMGVATRDAYDGGGLVVDALIGYSLRGAPRGRTAALIAATGRRSAPVRWRRHHVACRSEPGEVSVRRRRWSVLVALLAVAATACGAGQPVAGEADGTARPAAPTPAVSPSTADAAIAQATPRAGATATTSDAAALDVAARPSCQPIERPPLQSGSHLLGGQEPPVPYSSQPPTSGWHSSGHFAVDVHGPGDPLSEPDQVSVLEADGVVVTYRAIPPEQRRRLVERVRSRYDGRVAVTPYPDLGRGEVAFTAWGVLRRCDGVDLVALDRFVRRFATTEAITPGH